MTCLVVVERGQVVSTDGLLLTVAALLHLPVSGQVEAHPGAGGGGGVLAGQEQPDQHASDLVI